MDGNRSINSDKNIISLFLTLGFLFLTYLAVGYFYIYNSESYFYFYYTIFLILNLLIPVIVVYVYNQFHDTRKVFLKGGIVFLLVLLYAMYTMRYYPNMAKKFYFFYYLFINFIIFACILLAIFWEQAKKKKLEIILLVCTIITMFFFFEGASRYWICNIADENQVIRYALAEDCGNRLKYEKHVYPRYVLTPNWTSPSALNIHNTEGYRGEEFSVEKPSGTFRIVAIGSSTTYTESVDNYQNSFTYLLEKELHEKYNLTYIEVINGGVGGYLSYDTLINFEFRILDLDPDMILLYEGFNDVRVRVVPSELYSGDPSYFLEIQEHDLPSYLDNSVFLRIVTGANPGLLKSVMSDYRFEGTLITETKYFDYLNGTQMDALLRNPPVYFERNLRVISAIADEFNISVVLSTLATTNETTDGRALSEYYMYGVAEHNEVIKKVGEMKSVILFDFAGIMPKEGKYWTDVMHETEDGAQKKAEIYAAFLYDNYFTYNHELQNEK